MNDTVNISLPQALVDLLGPPDQAAQVVREFVIQGLFREGRLSAGKAAELLELTPKGFVAWRRRSGVDYFRFGPGEWEEEVAAARSGEPGVG
jgi:predicted HTH domain antitoxin